MALAARARSARYTTTASCASTGLQRRDSQDAQQRQRPRWKGPGRPGSPSVDGLPLRLEPEGREFGARPRVDLHRAAFDKLLLAAVLDRARRRARRARRRRPPPDIVEQWDPERALGGVTPAATRTRTRRRRSARCRWACAARRRASSPPRASSIIAAIVDVVVAVAAVGAHLEAGEVEATPRCCRLSGCTRCPLAVRLPTAPGSPRPAATYTAAIRRRLRAVLGAAVGDGGRGSPTAAQAAVAALIDAACRGDGCVSGSASAASVAAGGCVAASHQLLHLPRSICGSQLSRICAASTGYSPFAFCGCNRSRPPGPQGGLQRARGIRARHAPTRVAAAFETTALELWEVLVKAARRLAAARTLALGLERDYFERSLEKMDLQHSAIPPLPPCDGPQEEAVGTSDAVRVASTPISARSPSCCSAKARSASRSKNRRRRGGRRRGGEAGGWFDVVTVAARRGRRVRRRRQHGRADGAMDEAGGRRRTAWSCRRRPPPQRARASVACFMRGRMPTRACRRLMRGSSRRARRGTANERWPAYLLMKLRAA